jgi:hypothetical protein
MIIEFKRSRVIDAKAEGNYSGDWVAQSKYLCDIHIDDEDKSTGVLIIHARLDMNFAKGGSVTYICELVYFLLHIPAKIPTQQLVLAMKNCPVHLEELFDREHLVSRLGGHIHVWTPFDDDVIRNLVIEKLSQKNLSYD